MDGLGKQMSHFRLTTAEIVYHMPDHPSLLQSYIWQDMDQAPRFPVLHRFLDFWQERIEGKLYSVRVMSAGLIVCDPFVVCDGEFMVH